MSYELRLKKLKEEWVKIQELRDEQRRTAALWRKYGKRVRVMGQEIKKALDTYNEVMV